MGFLLVMLCVTTISLGDLPVIYGCMEWSSGWLQAMGLFICLEGGHVSVHAQTCVYMGICMCTWAYVCAHGQMYV